MDIIAWKPWEDFRVSQFVLLVQCASGKNWKTKLNDLNLDAWKKYIHFAANPIKAFTIPIVITNQEELQDISTDAGIIIDRARIYKYSIDRKCSDISLKDNLITWCNNRMEEITN